MASLAFDVQPLFAVPIFRTQVGHAISPEQENTIRNLPMRQNPQNLISEELYLFERPEMASIKAVVQQALDIYATDVMGIEQQLYVTQSWSLINPPGVGMHSHSHSNSVVSGSLYFTDLPEPPARMIFDRFTAYRQLQINPAQGKQNLYNTPANVIIPKKHELVLFPSDLNHMVEANASSQPRYSIAFNCFVRGQIGSFTEVSQLTLR